MASWGGGLGVVGVLGFLCVMGGLEGNMSADSDELSCIRMVCNIFQSVDST